jgi:hypothetical protein
LHAGSGIAVNRFGCHQILFIGLGRQTGALTRPG